MAKCIYCKDSSGFLRRTCEDCTLLLKTVKEILGNTTFGEFLDALAGTGVKKEKIKLFLYADPWGKGSLYDQITAEMANDLIHGMGIDGHQTPEGVKQIREEMRSTEE